MVERTLVDHRLLIERFREAVDCYLMDVRAYDLPNMLRTFTESSAICSVFPGQQSSFRVGSMIDTLKAVDVN